MMPPPAADIMSIEMNLWEIDGNNAIQLVHLIRQFRFLQFHLTYGVPVAFFVNCCTLTLEFHNTMIFGIQPRGTIESYEDKVVSYGVGVHGIKIC